LAAGEGFEPSQTESESNLIDATLCCVVLYHDAMCTVNPFIFNAFGVLNWEVLAVQVVRPKCKNSCFG